MVTECQFHMSERGKLSNVERHRQTNLLALMGIQHIVKKLDWKHVRSSVAKFASELRASHV